MLAPGPAIYMLNSWFLLAGRVNGGITFWHGISKMFSALNSSLNGCAW